MIDDCYSLDRALSLELCPQCMCIFTSTSSYRDTELMIMNGDRAGMIKQITEYSNSIINKAEMGSDSEEDGHDDDLLALKTKLSKDLDDYISIHDHDKNETKPNRLCPCCHGYLTKDTVNLLEVEARQELKRQNLVGRPVVVTTYTSPTIDLTRLFARAIILDTTEAEKLNKGKTYPCLDTLIQRMLTAKLRTNSGPNDKKNIEITDIDGINAVEIRVHLKFHNEIPLCHYLFPSLALKGVSRSNLYHSVWVNYQNKIEHKQHKNKDGSIFEEESLKHSLSVLEKQKLDINKVKNDDMEMEITHVEKDWILNNFKDLWESRDSKELLTQFLIRYHSYFKNFNQYGLNEDGMITVKGCSMSEGKETSINSSFDNLGKELWAVAVFPRPMYVLGRYRKLARDVPQSPWTFNEAGFGSKNGFTSTSIGTEENTLLEGTTELRKGRYSVEEIVSEPLSIAMKASAVRLHACGREDIDVRCLGNGRPFCCEVLNARIPPTITSLNEAENSIKNRLGLNKYGDIDMLGVKQVDRSVWEGMQKAAEEKDKGYVCVVWSAKELTHADISQLEHQCQFGPHTQVKSKKIITDKKKMKGGKRKKETNTTSTTNKEMFIDQEMKRRILIIAQKTPLRVLHRRSLLTRTREISDVQCALLGPHHFLMRLQTSAGAYVKEWVHGDLGRTTPSVSSMLQTQADILQLDVSWLFDDFEGGGAIPPSEQRDDEYRHEMQSKGLNHCSWKEISSMQIPSKKMKKSEK